MADFDPARTNKIYDLLSAAWRSNRDFAEMHEHILRDGTYLQQFNGVNPEPTQQLDLRKGWALALDLCQDLVDIRVGNLFRTAPSRQYENSPYKAEIEAFLQDVDAGGTSMDDYMRRAARLMYVNGVDLVVDKDSPAVDPVSKADEEDLRVYLQMFSPLERLDWDTDHAGAYTFARYDLGPEARKDETEDEQDLHLYLTYTRAVWRRYTVRRTIGPDGKEKVSVETAEGSHTLKLCPVVPLYYRLSSREDFKAVPLSLLTRLTPIAKYMLNLTSQAQLDLYLTVAFIALFGVRADEVPGEMGAGTAWAFDNPEGSIERIVADVPHIVEKREWLELCTRAMLRIGKLTGLLAELQGRAQSGVQVAIESGPLYNELSATAAQMEEAEQRIMQYVLSRRNPPAGGALIPMDKIGYSVAYNRRYMIEPTSELVDTAKKLAEINVHDEVPSMLRLALRKIADAMGRSGDEDYDAFLKEITTAVFGGVTAGNVPPDGDEDGDD